MINQNDILRLTVHGLNIYAHILGCHYKQGIVLELLEKKCNPALNPFNGDKESLLISQQDDDDVFCYQDAELADFKGNPFDFAALHYNLQGDELLEKLNEDMNLHLGSKENFYETYIGKEPTLLTEMAWPRVSFYFSPISNTKPYAQINLLQLHKLIKGNRYKPRTERLRAFTDPQEASKFKQNNFEYVTFGGTFSKRSDKALIHPSGLLVLDFDHVNDLPGLRKILLGDPLFITELMFKSPSGKGLKWIISVDLNQCTHLDWFTAVASYLDTTLQVTVDRSGKDISRACFLCHDPDAYINPDYLEGLKD